MPSSGKDFSDFGRTRVGRKPHGLRTAVHFSILFAAACGGRHVVVSAQEITFSEVDVNIDLRV